MDRRAATIGLACLLLAGCASHRTHNAQAALGRFLKVDDGLYRGAQPTDAGFRHMQAMGIRTVISLRAYRPMENPRERKVVESLGMKWISLPMRMYWRPTDRQVRAFLAVALDPANQPVFVHCQHGEDRTGSIVAIYRIIKQGWLPQSAYDEALALGMADWNPFTRKLILKQVALDFNQP